MTYHYSLLVPGTVIEVTFRTEEGLPFVANALIRHIIESVMAAAQAQYGQVICDFIVMGNHIHMILYVRDSSSVVGFIEYVKRETAIAVNKLLGRRQKTVWTNGYNPAVILDVEKLIERKVYTYTNPQKADLVETIEQYPGLNTWQAFLSGGSVKILRRIPRNAIPTLGRKKLSPRQIEKLVEEMCEQGQEELELRIEPDAWMDGVPGGTECDPEAIIAEVASRVRQLEAEFSDERQKSGRQVAKQKALINARMDRPHTPTKFGRRVICYASDIKVRACFITWFKSECKNTWDTVRQEVGGVFHTIRPPGFFAPGGFLACNLNPHLLQDVLQGGY
jgi:REP element-mobilizing transposase RayT